jgi:hypothetical protein
MATLLAAGLAMPMQAQTPRYGGAIAAGRAFMLDLDDPDPAGSWSYSASLERGRAGRSLSTGVEIGVHRYLVISQDLSDDVTGYSSFLEDTRRAWRLTPYFRWRTRGDLSLNAMLGAGLYVRRGTYRQQEREGGEVVYDTEYTTRRANAGLVLGIGAELFPTGGSIGVGVGVRTHAILGGGDGFNSAEVGVVWRP